MPKKNNKENENMTTGSKTIDFQRRLLEFFCNELQSLRDADSEDHSKLYDQAEFIGSQIIRGER